MLTIYKNKLFFKFITFQKKVSSNLKTKNFLVFPGEKLFEDF
jgi:hypothetical protein